MRGDRTNYGNGRELTRITVRLTLAEVSILRKAAAENVVPPDASLADVIKALIALHGTRTS